MPKPGLSVTLSGLHRLGPDLRTVVEAGRLADEAGVDQIVLPEHVVMGERTDRYPYGRFPYGPEAPWLEPLTTLAAIAAVTTRVRLSTGVLLVPLRPAVVLAKEVATLDVLSHGRVDLGVGVGWQREEHAASGVRFDQRWRRLDDTLGACRALWSEAPASFSSATVSFDGLWCSPQPVQARLPIWFGAALGDALARRLAAFGDGWYPLGKLSPDDVRQARDVLGRALEAAGRSRDELGVRVGLAVRRDDDRRIDGVATMAPAPALIEAGATLLSVTVGPGTRSMDDVRADLEALTSAFTDVRL